MTMMLAARLHEYGAPMVLEKVPVPEPRATDVCFPLSDVNSGLDGSHYRDGGFTNLVIVP
jgi:hypothetical protein